MTRSLLRRIDDALCALRFGHTRRDLVRAEDRKWYLVLRQWAMRRRELLESSTPPDPFADERQALGGHAPEHLVAQVDFDVWFVAKKRFHVRAGRIVVENGFEYWVRSPIPQSHLVDEGDAGGGQDLVEHHLDIEAGLGIGDGHGKVSDKGPAIKSERAGGVQ